MYAKKTLPISLTYFLTCYPQNVSSLHRKRTLLRTSFLSPNKTKYQRNHNNFDQEFNPSMEFVNEDDSDMIFERFLQTTSLSTSMSYNHTESPSSILPTSSPSLVPTQ